MLHHDAATETTTTAIATIATASSSPSDGALHHHLRLCSLGGRRAARGISVLHAAQEEGLARLRQCASRQDDVPGASRRLRTMPECLDAWLASARLYSPHTSTRSPQAAC